ncbi:MAG: CobW family GTP-binding protein [Acidiphilium sp.]
MAVHEIEARKVPVTILTGFLGSGKTTLLNYILTERHGHRIAVIENEFGEVDVDSDLVLASDEEIFQMQNGCICCFVDVRNDLIEVMKKLLARKEQFDHVIVETSGLADPTPVATSFFADRAVADAVQLDAIVTLVDAAHIDRHLFDPVLDGKDNQAVDQIVAADRIILNKIDLARPADLDRLETDLRMLNETAGILRSSYGRVDLDTILGINGFTPSYVAERAKILNLSLDDYHHDKHQHHGHMHDPTVGSESFTYFEDFDLDRLHAFLTAYLATHGDDVFRTKGIIAIDRDERFHVLQAVHRLIDLRPDHPWRGEARCSKIVLIGRNLDRAVLEAGLRASLAQPKQAVAI